VEPAHEEIWRADKVAAAGLYHNVVLALWCDSEPSTIRSLGADITRTARRLDVMAIMHIIDARHPSGLPSEARAEFSKIMRDGSGYIRCVAAVFEETGFRAAMVRAIVTGMNVLAGTPFQHHVFADAPTGAGWVLEHLGAQRGLATHTGLLRNVAALRKAVDLQNR